MEKFKRSGRELRGLRSELGVTDAEVLVEARISMSALYKVYRDDPTTRIDTRNRVVEAFDRLAAKSKVSA